MLYNVLLIPQTVYKKSIRWENIIVLNTKEIMRKICAMAINGS